MGSTPPDTQDAPECLGPSKRRDFATHNAPPRSHAVALNPKPQRFGFAAVGEASVPTNGTELFPQRGARD